MITHKNKKQNDQIRLVCAYVYLAAEALDVFHLLMWKGFCFVWI